ncbi:uncharacterized protein LOC125088131 [Lutra lutra]|uniref:uncharacterized protein LOC125088131 n=1 Tax=Lutra lutra TaxID=9657 RepID=UPI001FD6009C|nr:uncharacterized protein LOC125088131 [Lutra lutra]XP_047565125.1 uncharacterized protein LOC125088131 [Lutra lutra]XP_047565126.1 uncharacterized protein LOC125088131 [Lutra lutra]
MAPQARLGYGCSWSLGYFTLLMGLSKAPTWARTELSCPSPQGEGGEQWGLPLRLAASMLAPEACVQVCQHRLGSWRVLLATAQALSLFPAHRGPGHGDCQRVSQVGKPAEMQVCTPVSARPGNQDRSEATWLSGGPAGQHGPGLGGELLSLGALIPGLWTLGASPQSSCLGMRGGEAGVRAGPWGCWGPPGEPSVLTPQGAGPWLHTAMGRLMVREAPRGRRLLVVSALLPHLLGPSSLSRLWRVLSLKCSFLGPNPALWTQAPGEGGELAEHCCERLPAASSSLPMFLGSRSGPHSRVSPE